MLLISTGYIYRDSAKPNNDILNCFTSISAGVSKPILYRHVCNSAMLHSHYMQQPVTPHNMTQRLIFLLLYWCTPLHLFKYSQL